MNLCTLQNYLPFVDPACHTTQGFLMHLGCKDSGPQPECELAAESAVDFQLQS